MSRVASARALVALVGAVAMVLSAAVPVYADHEDPDAVISVWPQLGTVGGRSWSGSGPVSVEVTLPDGTVFSGEATPGGMFGGFQLPELVPGGFDAGTAITASQEQNGHAVTESMVVPDFAIEDVSEANVVSGRALPDAQICLSGAERADGQQMSDHCMTSDGSGAWASPELEEPPVYVYPAIHYGPDGDETFMAWFRPRITVDVSGQQVGGSWWPAGRPMTLDIDDLSTDVLDLQVELVSEADGTFSSSLVGHEAGPVGPGWAVTATVGEGSATIDSTRHVVTDTAVASVVSTDTDGTLVIEAAPNSYGCRSVTIAGNENTDCDYADADGRWVDRWPGMGYMPTSATAREHDELANRTANTWTLPTLSYSRPGASLTGTGWDQASTVRVTAAGQTFEQTVAPACDCFALDLALDAGDVVSVTDGIVTLEHTVAPITVTSVNGSDASGTATPDTTLCVTLEPFAQDFTPGECGVPIDADGNWTVSHPDGHDIRYVYVAQREPLKHHNETTVAWQSPTLTVDVARDVLTGAGWGPNAPVDVLIDGEQLQTTTDLSGTFVVELTVDVTDGTQLVVSDPDSSKRMVASHVDISSVDGTQVAGSAAPHAQVCITTDTHRRRDCSVTADADGQWSRTETNAFAWLEASIVDADGDASVFDWSPPEWPSAPAASMTVVDVTSSSVHLAWPAAGDEWGHDDVTYAVSVDGAPYAQTSELEHVVAGLAASTTYTFEVVAVDRDGTSDPLTVSATTDPAPATGGGSGGGGDGTADPSDGDPYAGVTPGEVRDTDSACAGVPEASYPDRDGTHAAAIDCASAWGLIHGTQDGRFDPNGLLTRGQMASVVVRAIEGATGEELPPGRDAFEDDDRSTHEASINKLAAAGLFTGRDGRALPNESISRGQLALLLSRAWTTLTDVEMRTGGDAFADDDGSLYEDAFNWLYNIGICVGDGDGHADPAVPVTRGQAAALLTRWLDALVDAGAATPPTSS